MKSKLLYSQRELKEFCDYYYRLSQNWDCPKKLGKLRVRAFYDKNSQMVGGYVIGRESERSQRYLLAIPPEFRGPVLEELPISLGQCSEISSMWIGPQQPLPIKVLIYCRLIWDIILFARRYVMAGSVRPKSINLHRQSLPHLIFEGRLEVAGQWQEGAIYYGSKWGMLSRFPLMFVSQLSQRMIKEYSRALLKKPAASPPKRFP